MAKRLGILTGLLAGLPGLVIAQSSRPSEFDEGYFSELPVVLSASRLVQTVSDAPASMTVIDRQMIQASGMRDVVDLLRLVPGMVVGMHKGHQATVGFHGFVDPQFRQLQVLIDGVSVYSPIWGGVEWTELPIAVEDIERIEVVRGPNAAAYGANSFLGAVNIIARDPVEKRRFEAIGNVGDRGIRDVLVRHTAAQGDMRYRLTAGQRSDEGLDSQPDDRRSNFMNLRGHYRVSGDQELRLQAGYAGGSVGQGRYAIPNHTDGPRPRHMDTGSVQLRWIRARGADDEIWAQVSHAEGSYREVLPYVLANTWNYPLDYGYGYRRTDLEMQHTFRLDESLRGVWGAQFRRDGARSRNYFASDAWQTNDLYRLFGNMEWRSAAGWIAAGGLMIEDNTISGSSASPSIAISRQLVPGHTVRLRTAKARRTPTLFEDRVNWRYEPPEALKAMLVGMGSPLATLPLAQSSLTRDQLDDERIRSNELSYIGQFPDKRLGVDLSWFEYRLSRLIGSYVYPIETISGHFPAGGDPKYLRTFGYINADAARIRGGSATMRWQPAMGTRIHLTASRTAIEASGPHASQLSASGPRHAVGLLVSQSLAADWQLALGYYRVGAMQPLSGGDSLPPTERVDLRLAKQFKLRELRGELAMVVKNATGSMPLFELRDIDRRTSWLHMRLEY